MRIVPTVVGRTLGRYKLVEEIGQGGMAVVYRGVDTTLQREVAVKILHPHLSRKESNRQRFAREARVVATLHHDNIVEIYDFSGGSEAVGAETEAFIVTEYIRGRTLADFIEKTDPLPVEIGVLMTVEICQAVAHAHSAGIVHRDIKPENVMIRQDGVLKLMDFGIARVNDDSGATMTGTLMGSPQYMSPEQISGIELDARSDLFSIAVLLYRLVTGVLPFDGGNPAAILRSILESDPAEPDRMNPLVGRALVATISRGLAKDPADRHPGVRELADELLAGIVEAGLGSARDELRAYFAGPDGYSRKLRQTLITRYAQAGHKRATRHDAAGAMELWSRVLELDGDNVEVRAALERLGRGRRNRRLAAIVVTVPAAALLLGFAGMEAWEAIGAGVASPTPTGALLVFSPPRTPAGAATGAPSPEQSVTSTVRPSPAPSVSAQASTKASAKSSGTQAPSTTPTTVAVLASIPAGKGVFDVSGFGGIVATIYKDGVTLGVTTLSVRKTGVVLDPGDVPLAFKANEETGCLPFSGRVKIMAGQRTFEILGDDGKVYGPKEVYLRGCRTQFAISLDPPSASEKLTVRIDGAVVGMGEGRVVPTTSGPHMLRVEHPNFVDWEQLVEIRHTQTPQEVPVTLTPR